MGTRSAGTVVLVHFPFSDLSQTKLRPALVLADAGRGDLVLCQITSRPYGDPATIPLQLTDFETGGLRVVSYARPAKLFTAGSALISSDVGTVSREALERIVEATVRLLRSGTS